jgi:hypothetical protein
MYGWGGDTTDWKKPGGYRYDSARAPYLDKLAADASIRGPRTYTRARAPNLKLVDPKSKEISTESTNPVVMAIDVTGSMAEWPAEIFDRLPLFYQTLSQYRDDLEVSFAAIGDANSDSYPLQVNDFGKGVSLEDNIKAIFPEGGGGGQISESYELFGHYIAEHCNTPKATSPFLFIFGDEKFYNQIDPSQVRHFIGDTIEAPLDSEAMWKGLMQRFNLYLLHKPYGHGNDSATDTAVKEHWAKVLGPQRIIELPSKERAVDIAMGIVAKHWGQYTDFTENLDARQDDPSIRASVHASLRFIPDKLGTSSVMGTAKSRKTKSLID